MTKIVTLAIIGDTDSPQLIDYMNDMHDNEKVTKIVTSDRPAPLRTFPPGAPRPGRPAGMTEEALAERRAAFLAELPDDPPPDARNKRLRPMQQDEVRAKIQSDRLVRQLQLNTLGLLTDIEGNPREMTPGQIKSALVSFRAGCLRCRSTGAK